MGSILLFLLLAQFYLTAISGYLLAAAIFVGGLYWAYRSQTPLARTCGVIIAASPAILFAVLSGLADAQLQSRLADVAGLPRVPVTDRRPTTLVIHGYVQRRELAALLFRHDLDTIYMFQSKPRGQQVSGERFERLDTARCRETVERLNEKTARHARDKSAASCLVAERIKVDPVAVQSDAFVLHMGHNSQLFRSHYGNTLRGQAPLELRLNDGGRSALVGYWERTSVRAPSSPFCVPISDFCLKTKYAAATSAAAGPESRVQKIASVLGTR